MASNGTIIFDNDFYEYSDWIELQNAASDSIDISGFFLSDRFNNAKKWIFPTRTIIPGNGTLLVWADGTDTCGKCLHTNFNICADGEEIALYNSNGTLIDSLTFDAQLTNVSLGRDQHDETKWLYFGIPTPGQLNKDDGIETIKYAPSVYFSVTGGNGHTSPFSLSLSSTSGAIYYTTDCSSPTMNAYLYSAPLDISKNTVIRARVFQEGAIPGSITSQTYLFDYQSQLPIVSIATDSAFLWDDSSGIYCTGVNGTPGWGRVTANYNQQWERPINIEIYDTSGTQYVNQTAGISIHGQYIRLFDQKSFSINASAGYSGNIDYQLFDGKPIYSFPSFLLHQGGNDWQMTLIAEGCIYEVVKDAMDMDIQAYRPAVLFLNSAYWGIYNFREKITEDYILNNYGIDPENIDMLEDLQTVITGNNDAWLAFKNDISNTDMSDSINFSIIENTVDVQEFINYMMTEIFFANPDWPSMNIRYWRDKSNNGKWRWILCGIDLGFLYEHVEFDCLNFALNSEETTEANSPSATLLFRKCMENDATRNRFIQLFAHHLASTFHPDRVTQIIDDAAEAIADEIPAQFARWGNSQGNGLHTFTSVDDWYKWVGLLKSFAQNRPAFQKKHISEKFNLSGEFALTIDLPQTGQGNIYIYDCFLSDSTRSESFFKNIPLVLKAVPQSGYRFAGWNNGSTDPTLNVTPGEDTTITPLFIYAGNPILPEHISQNDTLFSSQSPYIVRSDVTIDSGVVLSSEPGVSITLAENACITVYGKLQFLGTNAYPIVFCKDLGSESEQWGGIVIKNGTDTSFLSHVIIRDATYSKDFQTEKGAVSIINSSVILVNSEIKQAPYPLYAVNSSVVIDSCTFSMTEPNDVVNIVSSPSATVTNSRFIGNELIDADGIDFDGVETGYIAHNRIYNFTGFNSDGIDLGEGSGPITICDNFIINCVDKGISVGQKSSAIITGNVIADCGQGVGIKDSCSSAKIYNNNFCFNDTAVACFQKNVGAGGGVVDILNCIFFTSKKQDVFVDDYSTASISYSISDESSLNGTNNKTGVPLFTNPYFNNFSLDTRSPCIGAGNPEFGNSIIGTSVDYSEKEKGNVIISEILFAPRESYEFIELFNASDTVIDISGYWFSRAIRYTFPDQTLLPSMACIVVTSEKNSDASSAYKWTDGKLSNEGDCIILYDNNGNGVDYVNYDVSYFPDALSLGASIKLIDSQLDNSLMASWECGITGGTPGQVNFWKPNTISEPMAFSYLIEKKSRYIYLSISIPEPGDFRASLCNLRGQLLRTVANKKVACGNYRYTIDIGGISRGIYLFIVNYNKFKKAKRIVVE